MQFQKTNMIAWSSMHVLRKDARKFIFPNTVFGGILLLTIPSDIFNATYVLEIFL
jgi:hypothetical protein